VKDFGEVDHQGGVHWHAFGVVGVSTEEDVA
jgi:hypothetical protein